MPLADIIDPVTGKPGYYNAAPGAPPAPAPPPAAPWTVPTGRYTPAQIARVREGLRNAGWPEADSAADEAAVAKYLSMAAPDDFSRELQASGAAAPGSAYRGSQDALEGIDRWSNNFRAANGRFPNRAETVAAWGDYGGAIVDFIGASGQRPSTMTPEQKAAFFKPLEGLVLRTPPGGAVGTAYAQVPTAEERENVWRRDYDTKRAEATDAYNKAKLALDQGQKDIAQAQLDRAIAADKAANDIALRNAANEEERTKILRDQQIQDAKNDDAKIAIDQGNLDVAKGTLAETVRNNTARLDYDKSVAAGWIDGKPTLERERYAIEAAKYGRPLEQAALSRGQPIQNYAGMPSIYGNVAPGSVAPTGVGSPPPGGPPTAGQVQGPEMPFALKTILEGRPLAAPSPGGQPANFNAAPGAPMQLRAAGAQAQANESPLEKNMRYEAYALAGKNPEVLDWEEEKVRRNLGGGLKAATYAPGYRGA